MDAFWSKTQNKLFVFKGKREASEMLFPPTQGAVPPHPLCTCLSSVEIFELFCRGRKVRLPLVVLWYLGRP